MNSITSLTSCPTNYLPAGLLGLLRNDLVAQ
jgi:hypothetical protein